MLPGPLRLVDMRISEFLPHAAQLLQRPEDLLLAGITSRARRTLLEQGTLIPIRRGFYVASDLWLPLTPHQQHVVALVAAHQARSRPPLFSHRSAATLWDAPVWSSWLARLSHHRNVAGTSSTLDSSHSPLTAHVLVAPPHSGPSTGATIRHDTAYMPSQEVVTGGMRHTDLVRTAADLARSEPFVVALACVDHLLHQAFTVYNEIDVDSWRRWRSELAAHYAQTGNNHGGIAVSAILDFASPASASPLESVSKLRMLQLGVDFELQRRIPNPRGGWWYLDFWFAGQQLFGECDGRIKYTDEALRQGRSAEDIVYAEKRRQNAVEGVARARGVRWGAAEVETRDTFAKMCVNFGVPFLGRPAPHLDRKLGEFLLLQP